MLIYLQTATIKHRPIQGTSTPITDSWDLPGTVYPRIFAFATSFQSFRQYRHGEAQCRLGPPLTFFVFLHCLTVEIGPRDSTTIIRVPTFMPMWIVLQQQRRQSVPTHPFIGLARFRVFPQVGYLVGFFFAKLSHWSCFSWQRYIWWLVETSSTPGLEIGPFNLGTISFMTLPVRENRD